MATLDEGIPRLSTELTAEISGDIPLSVRDRFRYLWRNGIRNLAAFGRGPITRRFTPSPSEMREVTIQSPSRLLTEAAFAQLLPRQRIPAGGLEVLEIGCGSGSMAKRLAALGYGGRYTGIDIDNRFKLERPAGFPFAADFIQTDAHAYTPDRPIDLMVSVSALEHIPSDVALIERLSTHMAPGGLQFHAVPAGSSLATYLWHGYRQYTPRALAERFGTDGTELVRIGGFGSFLLHLIAITPEMFVGKFFRNAFPNAYRRLLIGALHLDRVLPVCPTAYIVIRRH